MLLVILGAGASADCVPRGGRPRRPPPLAVDLFSRDVDKDARGTYAEMAGVVERLIDLPAGVTVEEALDNIQREAEESYPAGLMALMAIRYYLRWVTFECTLSTIEFTASVTNYASLVARLDRWRVAHPAEGEILVVNFNYDTIFDNALTRQLVGLGRPEITDYVSWVPGWSNVKIHGSCDWAEIVSGIAPGTNASAADVIRAAHLIHPTRKYLWWDRSPSNLNSVITVTPGEPPAVVIPAVALPLRRKTTYSCPEEHMTKLREQLNGVTRILTIGWRGQDEHFLEELRGANLGRCEVLTVTRSIDGQSAVATALGRAGVHGSFDHHVGDDAFTTLLRTDKLTAFLSHP